MASCRRLWSRTTCDLTTPPRVILGSSIGIVPADGETTGRRIRINRPDDENARCKVQKRRVSTEISLLSCSSPQHLQRPTPSHFSKHTPSVQGLGHADVARSRCCSVSKIVNEIVRVYRSTT